MVTKEDLIIFQKTWESMPLPKSKEIVMYVNKLWYKKAKEAVKKKAPAFSERGGKIYFYNIEVVKFNPKKW